MSRQKQDKTTLLLIRLSLLCCVTRHHLQRRAVLEAEAVLEQAGDVGQVHAQEGAAGRPLGHLVAHCGTEEKEAR